MVKEMGASEVSLNPKTRIKSMASVKVLFIKTCSIMQRQYWMNQVALTKLTAGQSMKN